MSMSEQPHYRREQEKPPGPNPTPGTAEWGRVKSGKDGAKEAAPDPEIARTIEHLRLLPCKTPLSSTSQMRREPSERQNPIRI